MKKPDIKFRVLIIGRANAGKTSILQRVCETTESPTIYRESPSRWGRDWVVQLDPTKERGEHNIYDELTFSNHDGYVFHDSGGFECGDNNELEVVQNFVREKSTARRLRDRLHAIWYCIPTDNQRPSLDLKHFHNVCPDRNVPVIAVFTKYEQFKFNIRMTFEDEGRQDWETEGPGETERSFEERYLQNLGGNLHFVRLERMDEAGKHCTELLEMTERALDDGVVAVMLLAVQTGNLELSINAGVRRACTRVRAGEQDKQKIITLCMEVFPYVWYYHDLDLDLDDDLLPDLDLDLDLLDDLPDDLPDDDQSFLGLLLSFVEKAKFSLEYNDLHHIILAVILVFEHATLLHWSGTNHNSVLEEAQSQYMQFSHAASASQFPAAFHCYSDAEFIQFILDHRFHSTVAST